MKNYYLLVALVLFFTFQSCQDVDKNVASTSDIELISPQKVYDAVHNDESVQLVDVRTKGEFVVSHLKGAQNICVTSDDFEKKIKTLDKTKPVYVYCKKGVRSANAAKKLRDWVFQRCMI